MHLFSLSARIKHLHMSDNVSTTVPQQQKGNSNNILYYVMVSTLISSIFNIVPQNLVALECHVKGASFKPIDSARRSTIIAIHHPQHDGYVYLRITFIHVNHSGATKNKVCGIIQGTSNKSFPKCHVSTHQL